MIRPRKMKRVELTVLERDVDGVIEYLGKRRVIHLSPPEEEPKAEDAEGSESGAGELSPRVEPGRGSGTRGKAAPVDGGALRNADGALERLRTAAAFLRIALPTEPSDAGKLPTTEEDALERGIISRVDLMAAKEATLLDERRKVADALAEARAFANL